MTNRVTIIEEMHQLAQAAVEKVTLDLTNESQLSEKDFKMKFVQLLAERILKEGNQYGVYSDGLFTLQDKLEALGWKQLGMQGLPEFVSYVDYANKVYVNNIPRAYYAELFFSRFWDNLQDNPIDEGIYKYTFNEGETMKHTPEMGGESYKHMYLCVEQVTSMPEGSDPVPATE